MFQRVIPTNLPALGFPIQGARGCDRLIHDSQVRRGRVPIECRSTSLGGGWVELLEDSSLPQGTGIDTLVEFDIGIAPIDPVQAKSNLPLLAKKRIQAPQAAGR